MLIQGLSWFQFQLVTRLTLKWSKILINNKQIHHLIAIVAKVRLDEKGPFCVPISYKTNSSQARKAGKKENRKIKTSQLEPVYINMSELTIKKKNSIFTQCSKILFVFDEIRQRCRALGSPASCKNNRKCGRRDIFVFVFQHKIKNGEEFFHLWRGCRWSKNVVLKCITEVLRAGNFQPQNRDKHYNLD